MAKGTIAFGKVRGKVGNLVFRNDVEAGTVISEYNPAPANPRTLPQVKQRNKMNLAGQISKLTPYAAIAGLSSNRRMARSSFISNMLKAIVYTGDSNQATIAPNKIVFSKGMVAAMTFETTSDTQNRKTKATVTISSENVTPLGMILIALTKEGLGINRVDVKVISGATGTIEVSENEEMNGLLTHFYAVPLMDTGVDARAAFNELVIAGTTISAEFVRTLVSSGSYGQSAYLGNQTLN